MTQIEYAWMIYGFGALGCTIAAWWMFLWAWRFVRYAAVLTVMVILFTPYAIDAQTMIMAPAIYTLVFEGMSQGIEAIKPLIKLMLGIWSIALILALVFVILTRGNSYQEPDHPRHKEKNQKRVHKSTRRKKPEPKNHYANQGYDRHLSREERQAREELLEGEVPMRAIRD